MPAAFLRYQIEPKSKIKATIVSQRGTVDNTSLPARAGGEVRGKRERIFIRSESGFFKAANANPTGRIGRNIRELFVEVLGSLMVAAIPVKKVFQKRKPPTPRIIRIAGRTGFERFIGIFQPLPKELAINTKMVALII